MFGNLCRAARGGLFAFRTGKCSRVRHKFAPLPFVKSSQDKSKNLNHGQDTRANRTRHTSSSTQSHAKQRHTNHATQAHLTSTHTHLPPHSLSHPHARAHPPGEPSPARSPPTSPPAPPPAASKQSQVSSQGKAIVDGSPSAISIDSRPPLLASGAHSIGFRLIVYVSVHVFRPSDLTY